MAPPKNRGRRRVPPSWGPLFKKHYETKGEYASTFRVRRVVSVAAVEEDKRAGTATYVITFEYEPLDAPVDCTEFGSSHRGHGDDCRKVEYAMQSSGLWTVTKMHAQNSGRSGGAGGFGASEAAADAEAPVRLEETETDETSDYDSDY
uniref:Uncharacterized protein n=1 Tax=Bicosoecida sp. CB-2014 TaxID=1486930 RepID=A0A7S1CEQ4_9STRA|mmetsp:Transcript_24165/g.83900  ORF Transcript_24165/g.83900 Transcript_24165/m.83900 type:complete len:148 (+) Transcript_24165:181-624(+)